VESAEITIDIQFTLSEVNILIEDLRTSIGAGSPLDHPFYTCRVDLLRTIVADTREQYSIAQDNTAPQPTAMSQTKED